MTCVQWLTRAVLSLTLAAVVAGCGGSPSSPSEGTSAPLAGIWRGTMTLTPDNGTSPETFATEWTLTEVPSTSGLIYQAAIRSQSTWFASLASGTVTADPGFATVQTLGFYTSPRGCQASFLSNTRGTTRQQSGSITGVDCSPVQFNGTLTLSR